MSAAGIGVRLRSFALRPEGPGDEPIVRRAHVSHRAGLLANMPLPPDALARLCDQQHDLQERHIRDHHPLAERLMVFERGKAVGRLVMDRRGKTWRIVDLALVPEVQRRGIGTSVLRLVIEDAAAAGAMLELLVGLDNPSAERLYRRMGFAEAITASATHRRLVHQQKRSPAATRAIG